FRSTRTITLERGESGNDPARRCALDRREGTISSEFVNIIAAVDISPRGCPAKQAARGGAEESWVVRPSPRGAGEGGRGVFSSVFIALRAGSCDRAFGAGR